MSQQPQNSENLAEVRKAMQEAQALNTLATQAQAGGQATHEELFNYTSSTGQVYQGIIVFKRPNTKDLIKIGGLKAQYFREAGIEELSLVDTTVRLLAHIVSYLKVVVVKSPPWFFDIDTLEDMDIVYEVYEAYRAWEDSFRKAVSNEEAGDSEASEGAKTLDS